MKITKELVVPNYGLEGTQGPDGKPAIYTTVTNQNIVLNAPYQGLPSDYSKANGSIQVFEGDKEVTQQATYTLKQTLNVAATLDFNKFKVTHVSTDNGMFIVTVSYKEFVSDIMITTNVVRNGQSGPQGDPGQDGPPTGIIESPTIPTEVYQGMLWKNTGNLSGFITDVTYIYRGSKWEKYIFTADNIYADNLAAITANLGDVTGGSFTGSKFINNFVDVPLLYNGTSKATGQTKIDNGQITIVGKIDDTFNFLTKFTADAISATIYYPNSETVMKAFSITPDGFLLADNQNGFGGQLLASSLTKTPWVDIPMRSGYSGASHNMPKYKITYNLDGTRTISFRGQIVKTSSAGVINMEAGTNHFYGDMPVNVRPNVEANGYGVTNSGNGCRIWVTQQGGMGARIGITKTNYVDLSNLSYIID